jgi:hypothetical protein
MGNFGDIFFLRLGETTVSGTDPNVDNLKEFRRVLDEEIERREKSKTKTLRYTVANELFQARPAPPRSVSRKYPPGTHLTGTESVTQDVWLNYADAAFRAIFRHEPDGPNGWSKFDSVTHMSLPDSDRRFTAALKTYAANMGSDTDSLGLIYAVAKAIWNGTKRDHHVSWENIGTLSHSHTDTMRAAHAAIEGMFDYVEKENKK